MNPTDTTMTNSSDDILANARALFENEGLPFPPVPAEMAQGLQTQEEHIFATKPLTVGPYSLGAYLEELLHPQAEIADYAVLGFDGYGTNSWAVHYYLVQDHLALLVQLPWGGIYIDAEAAAESIRLAFALSAALQSAFVEAQSRGLIPVGQKLIVIESQFDRPDCLWRSTSGELTSFYQPSQASSLAQALSALQALLKS